MRKSLAATLVLAALGMIAPAALAQEGSRQTAKLEFTTKRPGAPSGHTLRIDYVNPDDPTAKPPAVRTVTEIFARGARIDTSAPELCTTSDPELMLLGSEACPPGSHVGAGQLTLDTGLPFPLRFLDVGVDFHNNTDELIFLNQPTALDVPRVALRAEVSRRRSESTAPFLPGTPPDGAAVDTVRVHFPVLERVSEGERRSYLTTPRRCPKRGFWVNRVRFSYADGVTQAVRSRSRCRSRSAR